MTIKAECQYCVYAGRAVEDRVLLCRRSNPQIDQGLFRWLRVEGEDWCGEFLSKDGRSYLDFVGPKSQAFTVLPLLRVLPAMTYEDHGKIMSGYWAKPIPMRGFDWVAWFDGTEEDGHPGYGSTRQEAIDDLLEQVGIDR